MARTVINTKCAPTAVGSYNQGIASKGFIFTAGQIPLNPETNELIDGDIDMQIDQIFHNLDQVCKAGNSALINAVKLTVFLTDLSLAPHVNKSIDHWFDSKSFPARSMVQVSKLPLNSKIEIECIAVQDE
jgi:2-iminobutanoate/2-iminopropanoate deaminase